MADYCPFYIPPFDVLPVELKLALLWQVSFCWNDYMRSESPWANLAQHETMIRYITEYYVDASKPSDWYGTGRSLELIAADERIEAHA